MRHGVKRRRSAVLGIVVLLCVVFGWVSLCIHYLRNRDDHVYIFQDIEECRKLALYENDATVTLYDDPDRDKNYRGQSYLSFVDMNYQSKTMSFTLYAYEFENEDLAKQYFVKATGKEYDSDYCWSKSGGMTQYQIVVAFENKAYCLTTKLRYIKPVDALLAKEFSNMLR